MEGLGEMEGLVVIAHPDMISKLQLGSPMLSRSNSRQRLPIQPISRASSSERQSPRLVMSHTSEDARGRRTLTSPTTASILQRRLQGPSLALEICGRSSPVRSSPRLRSPLAVRSPAVSPFPRRSRLSSPLARSPVRKTNAGSPLSSPRARSPVRRTNAGAAEMRAQCDKADKALALVRNMQAGLRTRLVSMHNVLTLAKETVEACGKAIAKWFGSLSGPALEAAIRETFNKFDADGSGEIDRHEFSRAMHELGLRLEDQQLTALFKECDVDGSGFIDLAEFTHMVLMHIKKPCKVSCQPCMLRGGCNQPHVYYKELSAQAASKLQTWCKAAIQRHSYLVGMVQTKGNSTRTRAPGVAMKKGSRILVKGLLNAQEFKYNGSLGTVEQMLDDSRVKVKMDEDGHSLSIKSECAVPLDAMSPEERKAFEAAFLESLSPEERAKYAAREAMSPKERKAFLESLSPEEQANSVYNFLSLVPGEAPQAPAAIATERSKAVSSKPFTPLGGIQRGLGGVSAGIPRTLSVKSSDFLGTDKELGHHVWFLRSRPCTVAINSARVGFSETQKYASKKDGAYMHMRMDTSPITRSQMKNELCQRALEPEQLSCGSPSSTKALTARESTQAFLMRKRNLGLSLFGTAPAPDLEDLRGAPCLAERQDGPHTNRTGESKRAYALFVRSLGE